MADLAFDSAARDTITAALLAAPNALTQASSILVNDGKESGTSLKAAIVAAKALVDAKAAIIVTHTNTLNALTA